MAPSRLSWLSIALALAVAAWDLGREHLPRWITGPVQHLDDPAFGLLDRLHTGRGGDYVAFMLAGLALLVPGFAIARALPALQ